MPSHQVGMDVFPCVVIVHTASALQALAYFFIAGQPFLHNPYRVFRLALTLYAADVVRPDGCFPLDDWCVRHVRRLPTVLAHDQAGRAGERGMTLPLERSMKEQQMIAVLGRVLPELEARVAGFRKRWPDRDILTTLHRNEALVADIRKLLEAYARESGD